MTLVSSKRSAEHIDRAKQEERSQLNKQLNNQNISCVFVILSVTCR